MDHQRYVVVSGNEAFVLGDYLPTGIELAGGMLGK